MRPRWLWFIALPVAVLGGVAFYLFYTPSAQTSEKGMDNYIKALSQKDQANQNYIGFTEAARFLAADLNRLQQQARGEKWGEISQALAKAQQSYEKAWLRAAQLEAELNLDANVKGFLNAATEAFSAQLNNLDKKLRAEELTLAALQLKLDNERARQGAQTGPDQRDKPVPNPRVNGLTSGIETVYFQTSLIPWLAVTFAAGFAFLIPWYRRFAEEEQYYSYSLTRTGRWTPVKIMAVSTLAFVVIFIAYFLIKRFSGQLL